MINVIVTNEVILCLPWNLICHTWYNAYCLIWTLITWTLALLVHLKCSNCMFSLGNCLVNLNFAYPKLFQCILLSSNTDKLNFSIAWTLWNIQLVCFPYENVWLIQTLLISNFFSVFLEVRDKQETLYLNPW